jgi:hypothetical protein
VQRQLLMLLPSSGCVAWSAGRVACSLLYMRSFSLGLLLGVQLWKVQPQWRTPTQCAD